MNDTGYSRRTFLRQSALTAAVIGFPAILRSQGRQSPNSRLNIALVGVGGRGWHAVDGLQGENYVAFCDVDDERAAKSYAQFPQVPRFRDYRRMLDRLGRDIDAVVVSTPDHMHYPIAVAAMSLGKHVYVEKPLAHTIGEARTLARLAAEKKVATQMGIQGHANIGTRLLKQWIDAGVLGEVREVISYSDRPIWPQGIEAPDHSKGTPPVPGTLDWDLWLGVAKVRDYDPAYLPFNWRAYWDFGTGALGDMGCHAFDGAYAALELTQPTRIEAGCSPATEVSWPRTSVVTFHFPARGNRPPVKWSWYDGGLEPPLPAGFEAGRKLGYGATFVVGSRATAMAGATYESLRIVPETRMHELAPGLKPAPSIRAGNNHYLDWVNACKTGEPAGANFGYSAQLTETVLLGGVAIRARRPIEWDAAAMKVTNLPEANRFVTKEYRPGFGV